MRSRFTGIAAALLVGMFIGMFLAPSFWTGIGKAIAEQQAANQQILTVAKVAMTNKTVCLIGGDESASAATQMLVSLGAEYASKEKADYLISGRRTKGDILSTDIDFCSRDKKTGKVKLLHRVRVSEKELAEHEACMFAWSLAQANKKS